MRRIFLGHHTVIIDTFTTYFTIALHTHTQTQTHMFHTYNSIKKLFSHVLILGLDLMPVFTAMMWTSASVRWWTHAKCCRSAMPVWSGYWSGWLTCASCLLTFSTPFCTHTASLPLQMLYSTSSLPSTRGPSVPSQLGGSHMWLSIAIMWQLMSCLKRNIFENETLHAAMLLTKANFKE